MPRNEEEEHTHGQDVVAVGVNSSTSTGDTVLVEVRATEFYRRSVEAAISKLKYLQATGDQVSDA